VLTNGATSRNLAKVVQAIKHGAVLAEVDCKQNAVKMRKKKRKKKKKTFLNQ
jgi:hypothetical protein